MEFFRDSFNPSRRVVLTCVMCIGAVAAASTAVYAGFAAQLWRPAVYHAPAQTAAANTFRAADENYQDLLLALAQELKDLKLAADETSERITRLENEVRRQKEREELAEHKN